MRREALRFEAPLADLKRRLASGERGFATLRRSQLLDNPHRATVVLTPEVGMTARLEDEEAATDVAHHATPGASAAPLRQAAGGLPSGQEPDERSLPPARRRPVRGSGRAPPACGLPPCRPPPQGPRASTATCWQRRHPVLASK